MKNKILVNSVGESNVIIFVCWCLLINWIQLPFGLVFIEMEIKQTDYCVHISHSCSCQHDLNSMLVFHIYGQFLLQMSPCLFINSRLDKPVPSSWIEHFCQLSWFNFVRLCQPRPWFSEDLIILGVWSFLWPPWKSQLQNFNHLFKSFITAEPISAKPTQPARTSIIVQCSEDVKSEL